MIAWLQTVHTFIVGCELLDWMQPSVETQCSRICRCNTISLHHHLA